MNRKLLFILIYMFFSFLVFAEKNDSNENNISSQIKKNIDIGIEYSKKNEHDKAVKALENSLKLSLLYFGEEHNYTLESYERLGSLFYRKREYDKALNFNYKVLNIREATLGKRHEKVTDSYESIGWILADKKEYDKAILVHTKALKIRKAILGKNHQKVADSYENIGYIWEGKQEDDKAIKFHTKALKIRLVTLGEKHEKVADSYENIGYRWEGKQEDDKAIKFHIKALKIRQVTLGEKHEKIADSYENIGYILEGKEEYDNALKLYTKALKIRKETLGDSHEKVTDSYERIGWVWLGKKEYDKGIKFHSKALKVRQVILGKNHIKVAYNYESIGAAWESKKEYDKALKFHTKAVKIREVTLGKEHETVANSYERIGRIWKNKKDYDKALKFHTKAVKIREVTLGKEHETVANSYERIGQIWKNKKDYTKARKFSNKALRIRLFTLGEKHEKVADSYEGMGWIEYDNRNFEKALIFLKKELNIRISIYGENSSIVIQSYKESVPVYSSLGYFYFKEQEYQKSIDNYIESILLHIKVFQPRYFSILMILLLIGAFSYYLKRNMNPLVVQLSKNPKDLLTLSPSQLKEAKKRLETIKQWESTVQLAGVNVQKSYCTLEFYEKPTIENFVQNLKVEHYEEVGEFYRISLPNLGLNIDSFLLLITKEDVESIKEKCPREDKIFVIGDEKYQDEIAKMAHNKSNNIIAPSTSELTHLLLSKDIKGNLAHILAKCLSFKYLSPYQTKGGLMEESNFFGRIEIIKEMLTKERVNYLLVGARQLGKTSILKALEREHENSSTVECHYVSLEYSDIVFELNQALKLSRESGLEQIVEAIRKRKKKVVFLIDEADKFIDKAESEKISSTFRKLSQEKHATFVLAGFWKLYYSATMDYQSPLKNFGEVIHLGELESEACTELMFKPMQRIGVGYENEKIVKQLIENCGNRANLIAMVCADLLKALDGSVIKQEDIDRGVESDNISLALSEWQALTKDEEANRINRLIVYLTFKHEKFTITEVLELIEQKELNISIEKIETSLKQLVLGFVLKEYRGVYAYRVPFVKKRLLEDEDRLEKVLERIVYELN